MFENVDSIEYKIEIHNILQLIAFSKYYKIAIEFASL